MRILDFVDGFPSNSPPSLEAALRKTVTGSLGSPVLITAAGGISQSGEEVEMIFVAGNGGPINITANPQIENGAGIGDEMILTGTHATNSIQLDPGTGLVMNGTFILKLDRIIKFIWSGTSWIETYRKD